jgi:hypothetical protein
VTISRSIWSCNLVLEHIADLSFIFLAAFRALVAGGDFFICELHPFRQYQGIKANFRRDQGTIEIPAFVHHISEFIHAAQSNGLTIESFNEWLHEDDQDKLPRLVSFPFKKKKVLEQSHPNFRLRPTRTATGLRQFQMHSGVPAGEADRWAL